MSNHADVGGEVRQGVCACGHSVVEDGEWWWGLSESSDCHIAKFCPDCGAELRADGTSVSRWVLPEAGEPRDHPNATPRYVSWYADGHAWSVAVCAQREGTARVVARVNAQSVSAQPFAAALLAAERKRREWAARAS